MGLSTGRQARGIHSRKRSTENNNKEERSRTEVTELGQMKL